MDIKQLEALNSDVVKAKQHLKTLARGYERIGLGEHADRIYLILDKLDAVIAVAAEMEAAAWN